MHNLGKFLNQLLDSRGLNPTDAAKIASSRGVEIVPQSLSQAISGKRGLDPQTVERLATAISLSDYEAKKLLLLSMAYKEADNPPALARIFDMIDSLDKNGALKPTTRPIQTEVPVWANIKAGSSDLTEQTATIHGVTGMTESEIREGYFCMLVSGDSMEGELIYDGDIAVFAPASRDFVERDIYAVEVEGYPVWMIKKLKPMPASRVALVSANPKHEAIVIDPTTTSIALKGRLVRTIRERGKSYSV